MRTFASIFVTVFCLLVEPSAIAQALRTQLNGFNGMNFGTGIAAVESALGPPSERGKSPDGAVEMSWQKTLYGVSGDVNYRFARDGRLSSVEFVGTQEMEQFARTHDIELCVNTWNALLNGLEGAYGQPDTYTNDLEKSWSASANFKFADGHLINLFSINCAVEIVYN